MGLIGPEDHKVKRMGSRAVYSMDRRGRVSKGFRMRWPTQIEAMAHVAYTLAIQTDS